MAANEASSGTARAATSQDARTLDLIAKKLREELPEDTSQVLLAALHAAAVGNVDTLKHYRRGYRAALVTLALAFGLPPAIIDGGKPLKPNGACPAKTRAIEAPYEIKSPPEWIRTHAKIKGDK